MTARATLHTDAYPDPELAGVGAPFFSTWRLGTDERQQAAVAAIAETWQSEPWPTDGLLGYHVYTSTDGELLLHYSQWADEDAYESFVAEHRQPRLDLISQAVPGFERIELTRYRRYRSHRMAPESGHRTPGCVSVVDVEFDGPDPERQRAWVDAAIEALADQPTPDPGGIAAHFHLSTDGTRVLNYAEWESEEAHIRALESPGEGIGPPSELWRRVREFPGKKRSSVRRYRLGCSLRPADGPGATGERGTSR